MKVYVELLSNNWLMFDSDTNKLQGKVAHGQHSLHCLQADSDVYIYSPLHTCFCGNRCIFHILTGSCRFYFIYHRKL